MVVRAFPNGSGSQYWRLEDPFKYLRQQGIDAQVSREGITQKVAEEADIYVLQSCVDKEGIALLYEYQQTKGKKIVVDADDYPWLNDDNPHLIEHKITQAPEVIQRTMEVADLVTTTNEYLADKLRKFAKRVDILPNYMDMDRWDLPKLKNTSQTVRIGWAGSYTHFDDFQQLVEPLRRICQEFPQVQLVFVGDLRLKELFPGLPVECIPGVSFEAWPRRLHGLRLDIGLAPLLDTEFNRCKSNIKWQEYSIAKVPGVYSYTVYHHRSFEPQFGLIAKTPDQWYQCIKNLIVSPALSEDISSNAYGQVKRFHSLEKNAVKWKKAYESILD